VESRASDGRCIGGGGGVLVHKTRVEVSKAKNDVNTAAASERL
jgi:hypothetical protein